MNGKYHEKVKIHSIHQQEFDRLTLSLALLFLPIGYKQLGISVQQTYKLNSKLKRKTSPQHGQNGTGLHSQDLH